MRTGQVFVSHTSDLARFPEGRSFVQAALDAVGRAGMAPVDMRYFAARPGASAEYCLRRVRESEVYVAIIGFRYGTVAPGEAVSYIELEFQEAGVAGLPRLVFLLSENADIPTMLADADRGAVDGFRRRLRGAGLLVREFSSDAGLELEVFHALRNLAEGASRGGPPALGLRYSLPPDTAAFTGRGEELAAIAAQVAGAARPWAVVAIGGMPGVGKTALAVHAAHQLLGLFPDRQLFIDLHAHTPGQDPVPPWAVLAGLLTAMGVDARDLPDDAQARADLWRERMAGQRALLVLDNAASTAQVIPLLPGGEGCLVLVTSRRHLGDLPGITVQVPLEVLPPDQAQAMFLRLAPRAAADPAAAVPELARLAGHLPLAISLLARVHVRHASWTLADLTRETMASLLTLAAETGTVAAAFDLSFRHLGPDQQRFFRCLGLHPGITTDAYAAAALAGVPLAQASVMLDALHGEGLLTETSYRRYGMHDLIRRYARDRAQSERAASRDRALARLLDYYQHTAGLAEALLARQTRPSPTATVTRRPGAVPGLADRAGALAWARAERGNLLACLDHATAAGQHARIIALTAGLAGLLRQDGPWADALIRHTAAVQAARRLGDRLGQADALRDLGDVRRLTGDFPAAAQDFGQALGIYRDFGSHLGEANALHGLGAVRSATGDYPGAVQDFEQALGIYRDFGSHLGEANALGSLGAVRWMTGDYPGAVQDFEQALGIYRDLGSQRGEANALGGLGIVRWMTGDYPAAAQAVEQALGIYRDLGDRRGEANALTGLGNVRWMTGDYPAAVQALEQALSIYRDLGSQLGEANTLGYLGTVRLRQGEYQAAVQDFEQALGAYRDLGSRRGEANALGGLGAVRRLTGDYLAAAQAVEQALGIYRDLGDRGSEAGALNETGTLHRVSDDLARAEGCHKQALELARAIASSWDEAHALAGLGRCALAAGHATEAQALLRRAHEVFRRIGAAEAAGIADELSALTRPADDQRRRAGPDRDDQPGSGTTRAEVSDPCHQACSGDTRRGR